MKKRVKVAIPKISDFKKFLDSKLKVNLPELDKDTKTSETVSFKESILEKVIDSPSEKSRTTSKRLQKKRELQEFDDKKSTVSDKNKKTTVEKLTKLDKGKNGPILESDNLLSETGPLELVKEQSDQIETKVPLLHQNLIGKNFLNVRSNNNFSKLPYSSLGTSF